MKSYQESIKISTVVSYITIALNITSAIVITPVIIQVLSLSIYGLYTVFGGLILLLSYLDLGIGNATTRFTVKYRHIDREFKDFIINVVFLCFIILLLITIIATFIYFRFDVIFFNKFIEGEQQAIAANLFYILAFNLCLAIINSVLLGFCNGFEHFLFPRKLKLINVVIRFLIIYFFIYEFKSIYLILFVDTLLSLILLLSMYFYLRKALFIKLSLDFKSVSFKSIKKILNFSFWLFVYSTLFTMIWEVGKILSGFMLGPEHAALYGLAVMLSGYVSFFSVTITSMYLPLAVKLIENKSHKSELEKTNIYIGRVSLIVFSYLIFGFILVGEEFITLWLGSGFSELYFLTMIMMLSLVFPLTQHFSSYLLEAKGYIKYKALSLLFFLLIGFVVLIYTYDSFGFYLFAIIPAISLQLFQLSQMFFYRIKLKISILNFITKTYLWFLPFLIMLALGVYFIDKITVDGLLGFFVKGIVFTILFSIVLSVYIRTKFLGWFDINTKFKEIKI